MSSTLALLQRAMRIAGPVAREVAPVGKQGYHITSNEVLEDILRRGLVPHAPSFGTDQRVWPDGATQRRSYFSPSAEHSWQFAPVEAQHPVLLRAPLEMLREERGTGDLYTTQRIPSELLELLLEGGAWGSLK